VSLKKQKYELKEYLETLCITQKSAAISIGCSVRHLNRVINGKSPAGYQFRKKLAIWGSDKIDVAKLAMIEPQKKGG